MREEPFLIRDPQWLRPVGLILGGAAAGSLYDRVFGGASGCFIVFGPNRTMIYMGIVRGLTNAVTRKETVSMQYAISFLEGIITFISPCLLPMLPIYISYFAGGGERTTKKTLRSAFGFVLGFTIVFMAMGALAGTVGSFLKSHQTAVNLISGLIVIFFGLNFLGVFKFNLFHGSSHVVDSDQMGFFSAMVFGIIFSLGWTPCVGAFLGSALMLASQQGHVLTGTIMLLAYSLGLGIPFVLSAVLIDYLKSAFDWVKQHYQIINTVSGSLLILIGVMMATGTLGRLLSLLS